MSDTTKICFAIFATLCMSFKFLYGAAYTDDWVKYINRTDRLVTVVDKIAVSNNQSFLIILEDDMTKKKLQKEVVFLDYSSKAINSQWYWKLSQCEVDSAKGCGHGKDPYYFFAVLCSIFMIFFFVVFCMNLIEDLRKSSK